MRKDGTEILHIMVKKLVTWQVFRVPQTKIRFLLRNQGFKIKRIVLIYITFHHDYFDNLEKALFKSFCFSFLHGVWLVNR